MSQAEQEVYVAESLNRALDEMEAHKKNGTKPMDARDLLRRLREEEAQYEGLNLYEKRIRPVWLKLPFQAVSIYVQMTSQELKSMQDSAKQK